MRNFYKIVSVLLAVVLLSVLVGCKDKTPDNPPEPPQPEFTLTLDKTELTVVEDEFVQLTATPSDPTQKVTFTVDNGKVVAVSSAGRVIGKNVGTATITATSNGVSKTCKVTVVTGKANDKVVSVQDDTLRLSMHTGAAKSISATLTENGEQKQNATFTYLTLDETIATVDEHGAVTPVSVGSTAVVVENDGAKETVTIEVYTIAMSTTDDWMAMLKCGNNPEARFYLLNDLDFTGIDYRTYSSWQATDDDLIFMGEVDGGGHTVANVTYDPTYPEQSIFGDVEGVDIHDIAIVNASFNASAQQGLFKDIKHIVVNNSVVVASSVTNVICDFVYSAAAVVETCGVSGKVYGLNMSNVFINMRRSDGGEFDPTKHYAISDEYYMWYTPNAFSNVVVCANGGSVNAQGQLLFNSLNIVSDTYFVCNSIVEATYRAFNTFDRNVFDITPGAVPTFK